MRQRGYIVCLSFILLMIAAHTVQAQSLANYVISQTGSITFNTISSSGNPIPSWRNSTQWIEDDNRSYPIPIGFDFWYNGTRYTEVSIGINGFLDFSSSTADGTIGVAQSGQDYDSDNPSHNRLSNTTGFKAWNALAPVYGDMSTQDQLDPLGASFKYLTSGVAPNRVFTTEWINLSVWDQIQTGTSYNFQVKLYETSGIIEFVYGTMTNGLATLQYKCGINAADLSGGLSAAVLRIQQTANSTNFLPQSIPTTGYTTTLPTSNSKLAFTPTIPTAPSALSFTSVTTSSMTVNWTDNATGEFGYALYRSNDGVNYSYIRQLVANTDSSSETGLAAGVTYYWKVFALSEGGLSGAGSGSQVTLAGSIPVSFQSGNWSSPSTWVGNAVPAPTDNIVISSGHIVSVDQNVTANKLTINGTLRIGNSTTARSLTIADSVKINSGGTLDVNTAFTQSGHSIILSGDILNNGTLDLGPNANSRCSITFNKLGNQTIGGSGSLTRFYLITLNMGSSSDNILDVFSTNFTTQTTGFLTLTNGTFRFSSPNTITPFTASTTIPTTGQLWLNHSSAVVTTTGGNITLSGPLRITNGTLNIGSVADNNLISNGGQLWIENGAVNVAGRFEEINSVTISRFKMNGGTMTVNTVGSTSAVNAPFNISVAGATFTMTGGTIVIQRAGTGNLGYKNIGSLTTTVTGGTLQMGNASTPNATTMTVNSTIPVYNFDIRNGVGTNAAQLLTNALTVKNNVIITSGTFDANGLEMTVGGNWSNAGTFTSGAGKVTFNGTTAQSVTKASVETFNKLAINTTSTTVTMNASITVNDSFQLTSGTVSIGANTLTLDGIVTSSGTLLSGTTGTVIYNRGAAAQNVLAAEYGNLTFSNFTKVLPASLMTIAGTFTPGTAAGHTVTGNTIELNSAGPQTISSFQYNNIILSGSGVKTLEAGADTALGSLSINSGVTLADNGVTLVVLGNLSNDGAHTGAGKISLSGSTQQTVSGAGTITNLQMNNAAGALMSGPKTIEGVLTLTNGVIVTNTDTMTISATGSVSRTSGHIFGWLRKNISAGSNVSVAFELGDTTNYTPAQFVFSTVSNAGTMSATTVSAEHPNIITSYINVADDVNRYWDTRRSNFEFTGTYSLTLTFVAADCEISGKTTFKMNVFDGSAWTSEVSGTNTTTTNQATGILVLGAYAVGLQDASGAYRTKASGEWNNFAVVWEKFNGTTWIAATTSPVLADGQITIRNGHIVTVSTSHTGGASGLDQILIETGGNLTVTTGGTFQIRNGAGVDLTVYGDLVWQGGLITANGTPVLEFLSGSKYNHKLNANAIVSGSAYTATWDPNSTIEVTGVTTTAPTKLNQAIGNLTWNCVSQTAAVSFTTNLTNVTGSLTVHATGTGKVILTTTNTTLSVQKNIVITGGSVCFKSGATNSLNVNNVDTLSISGGYVTLDSLSTATTARINVADYFSMTNGTLNFNSVNNLVNGGTIYIAGNYSVTGGSLLNVGTGTASGSIVFNGTQRQTITSGATVTGNIDYTINTGAWLALGTSTVTGRNFTLSASTTFEIGSPNGISSAGATG
ncbi:MAG: hypothetical protein M0R68_10130, partial [Bacteroidetes bacterium]|nr:hypothetical protein [Bacteroidota bacterium]